MMRLSHSIMVSFKKLRREWENGEKMEKLSEDGFSKLMLNGRRGRLSLAWINLKNRSKSFSFWDFTTFGLLLVVSTIIGIYFGWKDRKNKDDNNYGTF